MNKGHIYFEIQADDTKRAIDFYSAGLRMEILAGSRAAHSLLDHRNRRFERGTVAAARQDAPAAMGHQCFCLLAGGREFRRNGANDPGTGRNRGASQVRGTEHLLAGVLRRPRRKHVRNFSSRSKRGQLAFSADNDYERRAAVPASLSPRSGDRFPCTTAADDILRHGVFEA